MVLRMKNFNIFGVHWKIRLLARGGPEKPIYKGDCLKRVGSWRVCWFKMGLGKKEEGGGVDTSMHTMVFKKNFFSWVILSTDQISLSGCL